MPAKDTLAISDGDTYDINLYLYWMETKDRLSAQQAFLLLQNGAGQQLAPQRSLNSGLASHSYWVTFTLFNTTSTPKHLVYRFNFPFLNSIEIYKKTDSGFERILRTGADLPFGTRRYPYYDFVYPIKLSTGETATYLILMENREIRLSTSPELISSEVFAGTEQRFYITIGLIMGIMLFNALLNIFLGVSLRDRIHYLYAAYVTAALAWVFSSVGTDYQFFFPDSPWLFKISQGVTGGVTMVLMSQLAIVFLRLRENTFVIYRLLNLFKWILASALLFMVLHDLAWPHFEMANRIVGNIYLAATAGIAMVMMWAAFVRIRQGFKPAWFYMLAMCFLTLSIFRTCYVILMSNDMLELVSLPNNIHIGLIIETLIIFAGIIYRYSLLKKEKKVLALKLAGHKLEMTQNVIAAQEEERKRLAQDLHDDLGATLSTLLLHITNQQDVAHASYNERSIEITQKALADLRNISHDLLPKDFAAVHLFQALANRISELNSYVATRFWLSIDGDDRQLDEIQSVTLYRIANELINNTIKHARASRADIDLVIVDGNVTLVFEDNGIGFDVHDHQKGIGLKNIHSRVAFLDGIINTDHNRQGSTIIIIVPLKKH